MGKRNEQLTVLASAARTSAGALNTDLTISSIGGHFIIDVTATAATPSVVFTIQSLDMTSGKYYDILTSAAITSTGTTELRVYPGAVAVANVAVDDFLPDAVRLVATHADTDSITYSVGFSGF